VSDDAMEPWIAEQIELLWGASLTMIEQCHLPYSLTYFKIDPIEFSRVPVSFWPGNVALLTFDDIVGWTNIRDIAFFQSSLGGEANIVETHHQVPALREYALIRPVDNGSFVSLEMEGDVPKQNLSIIDCLHRAAARKNINLKWRVEDTQYQNSFGLCMNLLIATSRER
jgi:hypothetical protein